LETRTIQIIYDGTMTHRSCFSNKRRNVQVSLPNGDIALHARSLFSRRRCR